MTARLSQAIGIHYKQKSKRKKKRVRKGRTIPSTTVFKVLPHVLYTENTVVNKRDKKILCPYITLNLVGETAYVLTSGKNIGVKYFIMWELFGFKYGLRLGLLG